MRKMLPETPMRHSRQEDWSQLRGGPSCIRGTETPQRSAARPLRGVGAFAVWALGKLFRASVSRASARRLSAASAHVWRGPPVGGVCLRKATDSSQTHGSVPIAARPSIRCGRLMACALPTSLQRTRQQWFQSTNALKSKRYKNQAARPSTGQWATGASKAQGVRPRAGATSCAFHREARPRCYMRVRPSSAGTTGVIRSDVLYTLPAHR